MNEAGKPTPSQAPEIKPDHSPSAAPAVTHAAVLGIALPIIASNLTTPLIGLVDTAVLGQLEGAHHIGAVALGATIFTFLFWAFGFLRMGTTGLTAQADGAGDTHEVGAALGRALIIAAFAGAGLVALQIPLQFGALELTDASRAVEDGTATYFSIRIWSAPAALANYAITGWLIGLQKARTALMLQVLLNGINAGLDALFVLGFGWGVAGVAWGTLIAEVVAAAAGLAVAFAILSKAGALPAWRRILQTDALQRAFSVNADIMIRTLALLAAFSWFTIQSAPAGDATLAANAVLMQLVGLTAHLLDGFAFAAETLVGTAVGARDRSRFHDAVRLSSLWAALIAGVMGFALLYLAPTIIDVLTVNQQVREASREALFWAALVPVLGVAAYQLDGIFIGATRTADMRNMMLLSTAAFFAAWALLVPWLGNDGRWLSLLVLNAVRAISLYRCFPSLKRDAFPATPYSRASLAQ